MTDHANSPTIPVEPSLTGARSTQPQLRNSDEQMTLWNTLWESRRRIIGISTLLVLVIACCCAAIHLILPTRYVASLPFEVTFSGVATGHYPNGLKFGKEEFVDPVVLGRVYDKNELEGIIRRDRFLESFWVKNSSIEMEMLEAEYVGRLSDPKLNLAERERLTAEFKEKRANLLGSSFLLVFDMKSRATPMPIALQEKVLNDILNEWALWADEAKGALRFRVNVLSKNAVRREFLENEEYVISIDLIRKSIQRIFTTMDDLSKLPNASIAREGTQRYSLAEARANLEDLLSNKVQPVLGLILSTPLCKNRTYALLFLRSQIAELKFKQKEVEERKNVLEASMATYFLERSRGTGSAAETGATPSQRSLGEAGGTTLIPQIGENFLDRIIKMAAVGGDFKRDIVYRQELTDRIIKEGLAKAAIDKEISFYEDAVRSFEMTTPNNLKPDVQNREELVRLVTQQIATLQDELQLTMGRIEGIYEMISTLGLNPRTNLYRLAGTFKAKSEPRIPTISLIKYAVLIYMVLFGLLIVYFSFPAWKSIARNGEW